MRVPKPTLAAIWLVVPVLLTLLIVWTNSQFPLDFWLHVTSGRWMCATHRLIAVDTFTHTIAGQQVQNQPWLAQLLMYQTYRLGGYPLVQFALGAAYGVAIGLITHLTYRRVRDSRVTAAVMVAAVAVASTNMAIRPQAFSVLLFAAELHVLSTWGARRFTPWVVAGIELLWSNTHGAFPLGVVLPYIFLIGVSGQRVWHGQRVAAQDAAGLRTRLLCCVLATGAMFVNPQGFANFQYVSGVASRATERNIEEWQPTSVENVAGTAFMLSVAGTLLVLSTTRRSTSLTDALLLASFFVVGVKSQRMVIWWALVFPAILAPQVGLLLQRCSAAGQRIWRAGRDRLARRVPAGISAHDSDTRGLFTQLRALAARIARPRDTQSDTLNWIVAASLCTLLALSTPWTRPFNPLLPPHKRVAVPYDEPLEAVTFLASSNYQGRMYQPMEWGSYVSWRLDPRVKVFVDSRIDFFPDSVWDDYVSIGTQPDRALATLDRYGVNLVLWDPRLSRTLPAALDASPEWRRVYSDGKSVVFWRG